MIALLLACGVSPAEAPPPAPAESVALEAPSAPEGPVEVLLKSASDLPAAVAAWRKAAAAGTTLEITLGGEPIAGSLSLADPFASRLPRVEIRGRSSRWSSGALTVTGSEVIVTDLLIEDTPVRFEASEQIRLEHVAILSSRTSSPSAGSHTAPLGLDLVARGPSVKAELVDSAIATTSPSASLEVRLSSASGGRFASVLLSRSTIAGAVRASPSDAARLESGALWGAGEGLLLGDALERHPWAVGGPCPWADALRAWPSSARP